MVSNTGSVSNAQVLIVNSHVTGSPPSSPRAAIGTRARQANSARAVSAYVPSLTRKAFEKYGFATASLLTDWASIVGADVASYTTPERLKWPRGVDAYAEVEEGAERRPGATLVVRVDGPRAIELQHKTHQIIDRINASFGYRAVAELRFVQAPIYRPQQQPPRQRASFRAPAPMADAPELANVEDEALRAALSRLHASIRGARAGGLAR